eukprot:scaffold33648_cov29-Tisochrysis_lutea.AAC.1
MLSRLHPSPIPQQPALRRLPSCTTKGTGSWWVVGYGGLSRSFAVRSPSPSYSAKWPGEFRVLFLGVI